MSSKNVPIWLGSSYELTFLLSFYRKKQQLSCTPHTNSLWKSSKSFTRWWNNRGNTLSLVWQISFSISQGCIEWRYSSIHNDCVCMAGPSNYTHTFSIGPLSSVWQMCVRTLLQWKRRRNNFRRGLQDSRRRHRLCPSKQRCSRKLGNFAKRKTGDTEHQLSAHVRLVNDACFTLIS